LEQQEGQERPRQHPHQEEAALSGLHSFLAAIPVMGVNIIMWTIVDCGEYATLGAVAVDMPGWRPAVKVTNAMGILWSQSHK